MSELTVERHGPVAELWLNRPQVLNALSTPLQEQIISAVADLDARIAPLVIRYSREADLLKTLPGFGDVVAAGWLGEIGPAPHEHFATAQRLASWATVCPGNYMSAKKSKGGRTGDGGAYIKPLLIQAAWAAVRVPGRLQARSKTMLTLSGRPMSMLSRISCSKKIRPARGRSSAMVVENSACWTDSCQR